MAIILDLLALVIMAVSIFAAYKKGLIKTLFSLIGGIVAVVLAVNLSTPVANWVDERFVGPAVRNTVLTTVNGAALSGEYDAALNSVDVAGKLQEMPAGLRSFLESLNIDVDKIIAEAEQHTENSKASKMKLIDSIAAPISRAISRAVALIGLVIILFILLFVVTRLLNAVFQVLPFGKTLNHAGGLILGVARAVLLVMILGAVIYGLAQGNVLISAEELDHTFVVKYINKVNPILSAFR